MNRKTFFVGLAILALLWPLATFVQAHMKIEKTQPADGTTVSAAPTSIQLFVTEKPDLAVTKVGLSGPSGKVELGPAHAMGEKTIMAAITGTMVDGKYAVDWQTAGDDGHVQKGAFTFTLTLKKGE